MNTDMIIRRAAIGMALVTLSGFAYGSEAESEPEPAEERVSGPEITGADAHPADASVIEPDPSLPPLPIEEIGNVVELPSSYPETWMLVNEAAFFNMQSGKFIILDVAEEKPSKRIKGIMDHNMLGNIAESPGRNEFYILEHFHSRGTRGPREDVLAIYDKTTLKLKAEIVWPEPKRLQALPERYAMSLSADEKFLYASNMSPATSFMVIDLDSRKIVSEVGTPGCVLTYPSGNRGIASICGNGAMLSSVINDDGTLASQTRLASFFDATDTPVFEHPVFVDGKGYFPSFKGLLHEFDMSQDVPEYLGNWSLVNEEQAAKNWRPSGMVLNDVDDTGLMYTIFQPDGMEGTQTHGGVQVWVHDLRKRELVKRIDTPNWAITLGVTRGENPLVVVTNGKLSLDVYNAADGSLVQNLADFGNHTPLMISKTQ